METSLWKREEEEGEENRYRKSTVFDPVCLITHGSARRTLVPVNIDLRARSGSLIRAGHKQIKSRLNPAQIVTNSHLNNDRVRGVTVSQNVAN